MPIDTRPGVTVITQTGFVTRAGAGISALPYPWASVFNAAAPAAPAKSYNTITSEMTSLKAKERKCEIVYPAKDELFIDLDSEEAHQVFLKNIEVLKQIETCEVLRKTLSPSGKPGHYHVVVVMARDVNDEFELGGAGGDAGKRPDEVATNDA